MALASVLMLAVRFLPAAADDRPVIAISPDGLTPERLEVHVGERVRWRAGDGQRIRLDLDRHPQAHEIIERSEEILAIFLLPGEHSYTASLTVDGHRHFRGTIVVRASAAKWELWPTCGAGSSDRICVAP
jgi:plastocyanin